MASYELPCQLFGQGQANPCHDSVPLAVFLRRIIDQHTVHKTSCLVAAIVPGPTISNAGNGEEPASDPFVLYASRRLHLLQEDCRRIILRIRHRLDRQICSMITSKEFAAASFIGCTGVLGED